LLIWANDKAAEKRAMQTKQVPFED